MTKFQRRKYEYFSGKCKWCRTNNPHPDYGWGLVLYPNPESLAKFKELKEQGLKNVLNRDDDGYYFSIRRPTTKTTSSGKTMYFEKPMVVDAKGLPFDDMAQLIGNGSDVTVKAEIYNYSFQNKKGVAYRLEGVKVDNLVPYEKDSFEPGSDEEKNSRTLRDLPVQEQPNF